MRGSGVRAIGTVMLVAAGLSACAGRDRPRVSPIRAPRVPLALSAGTPHGDPMAARLRLDRFLPYRLSIASNLVSDRIARAYQALFGLTIPEWRLVAVLAEEESITPMALGERTRMDKVTVSRAATALLSRGLLVRTPHVKDGRSHFLDLSPAGRELYARVAPEALKLERQLLAGFSPEEVATFTAMLRRLEQAALR